MDSESIGRRGLRLRLGLGAGVVLVLLLAGVAVIVTAVAPHGSTATVAAPSARPRAVQTDSPGGASGNAPTAFVHIVGQVAKPGLYELAAGSRIVDAVAAAGGFTPTADQAGLNLAQVVTDGQQIVVAVQGAAPAAGVTTAGGTAGAGAVVDINSADAAALETLDGIGPALAQRILAYRTAHGGFRSVNDLQNVTGIGPKKFAAIKSSIST
jgi:competence protein ComEA